MTSWPLYEVGSMERGPASSGSLGVAVGPSGVANTKTGWTQLIASTKYETSMLGLIFRPTSSLGDMLFDIGIGAAASEVVVIPNIYVSGAGVLSNQNIWLPISIPSGKRIAARMQGVDTVVFANVTCYAMSASMFGEFGFQHVDSLGSTTIDSGGTAIDAGAVANTKGAYTTIVNPTTDAYRGFYVLTGNNSTDRLTGQFMVDIAVGGIGSEQIIVPDLQISASGSNYVLPPSSGPFFFNIPSGVRLAARCQCSVTTAADRVIDIVLLALR